MSSPPDRSVSEAGARAFLVALGVLAAIPAGIFLLWLGSVLGLAWWVLPLFAYATFALGWALWPQGSGTSGDGG